MTPGWGWYFYFFRNVCIAPAVRPAQPRFRWVPGALSLGAGHGADRPPSWLLAPVRLLFYIQWFHGLGLWQLLCAYFISILWFKHFQSFILLHKHCSVSYTMYLRFFVINKVPGRLFASVLDGTQCFLRVGTEFKYILHMHFVVQRRT